MDFRNLSVVMTVLCYAFIPVSVKLIGDSMHFMTINFFRVFVAFLFLALVISFFDKKTFVGVKKNLKHYVFIGFLMAINFSVYNTAFLYAPVSNVTLIVSSYVLFSVFLARIYLKEDFSRKNWYILGVGFLGLVIMHPIESTYLVGNILSLLGAVFYAIFIVALRYEQKTHSVGATFWYMLFASLFLLPFALYFGFENTMSNIPWLLLLGIVATGIAYLFLDWGLQKVSADMASLMIMILTPLFSIIAAVIIFKEKLMPNVITGGLVLLAAGILLEKDAFIKKTGRHLR